MVDRAHYLARTLIARLANLQQSFAEDGRGEPERRQRIEVIEKVLAIELGMTDGTTMALIEATVPHLKTDKQSADRDVAAFAEFLRRRLAPLLTDTD
jgi:hypothetical protein